MSKRRQRKKRAAAKTRVQQSSVQPTMEQAAPERADAFTIDPDLIEKHMLEESGEFKSAIQRVVVAGMKVLFSKQTHAEIFDSIRPNDQVPLEDELGAGTTNLMLMLYRESKQTMPGQAIIPSGIILLAKASKFVHDTKLAPITDDVFAEAVHMFVASIQAQLDPNFRKQAQEPKPAQQAGTGMLASGG